MTETERDGGGRGERRRVLKAIMFTDVKGYSAMMARDEEATVRLLEEHRRIVRELLPRFHGKEHETIGDAFLVLFDSAVDAVDCAVAVQRALAERNASADDEIWIRIGIHLGDILVEDGGDIYGDGVNVAARVEPLAVPGGVCITDPVFQQVRGKVEWEILPLGTRPLKNIPNPPALHAVRTGVEQGPIRLLGAPRSKKRWPLALGLVLLLGALASLGGFFLRDRRQAHTHHRPLAAGRPRPARQVGIRFSRRPKADAHFQEAYRALLQARWRQAERECAAGLRLDPESRGGHFLMAQVASFLGRDGLAAREMQKAVAPGDSGPVDQLISFVVAANQPVSVKELDRELSEFERLHPDFLLARVLHATMMLSKGRPERAAEVARAAFQRAPWSVLPCVVWAAARLHMRDAAGARKAVATCMSRNPDSGELHRTLGRIALIQGHRQEAVEEFRKALQADAGLWPAWFGLAQAQVFAGHPKEALETLTHLEGEAVPAWASVAHVNEVVAALWNTGRLRDAEGLAARSLKHMASDPVKRFAAASLGARIALSRRDFQGARRFMDSMRSALADVNFPVLGRIYRQVELLSVQGRYALARGDLKSAKEIWKKLQGLDPRRFLLMSKEDALLDFKWRLAMARGDHAKAAALYRLSKAASGQPLCIPRHHRCMALWGAGDAAKAAACSDELLAFADYCAISAGYELMEVLVARAEWAHRAGQKEVVARLLALAARIWPSPDRDLDLVRRLRRLGR